ADVTPRVVRRGVESAQSCERTMRAKRFTRHQIIAVLKEAEAGTKTNDPCRRYGISDVTFYNWKAKYRGLTVSEARQRAYCYNRWTEEKSIKAGLLSSTVIILSSATAVAGNILNNGDFSKGFSCYSAYEWSANYHFLLSTDSHSGGYAAELYC